MQIGELAKATGVSRGALRYYESRGLIRSDRDRDGHRDYRDETVTLVVYIRMARRLGFSVSEIGAQLPALWRAEHPDQAVANSLEEDRGTPDEGKAGGGAADPH